MLLFNPTIYTTAGIYSMLVLCLVTAVFVLAQLKQDNSIMDIFYGPIYAISFWGTWYLVGMPGGVSVLVGALVTLWALRLGGRIARKNWNQPEDARYAAWRTEWCQRGSVYFLIRSYLQIKILQGFIIVLVATPLWLTLGLVSIPTTGVLILGAMVVLTGILYESIADWQLDAFIARKKADTTEATLMKTGLFRYSRRPNYFGESLVWWGFALLVVSNGLDTWFVLVSPILITYILLRVTGPMLEEHFLEKYPQAYAAYMAETNYFIPGPPTT